MSRAAQSLILDYLDPPDDSQILALEGGDGWLAWELAQLIQGGNVLTLSRDYRDFIAAQDRLSKIPIANAVQEVFPKTKHWDIVLLTIPKERRYARTLLVAAWEALKPNGKLFLAGPSKGGAKAVIKDAERLFGNSSVLGYRKHQRVGVCFRGNVLPDPLPEEFQQIGIAPGTRHFIAHHHAGRSLKLETHPGIFSWGAIDEGTALLLDSLEFDHGSRVWDVGCGYGAIGLSALLAGAGFVTMSDVNLLATDYTQRNVAQHGFEEQAQVFPADNLSLPPQSGKHAQPDRSFDLIISNPAFHQHRSVDKSMAGGLINNAASFLAPNGRLIIVANRFLDYHKLMGNHFNHVKFISQTSKFHVMEAHH